MTKRRGGEAAGVWPGTDTATSAKTSRLPATFIRLGLLLDGLDGTAPGQEAIEAHGDVLQVRGIAAADLGRHPAVVADVGEGLAHFDPVDIALPEVLPRKLPARTVELEVLQVDLGDARPQGADPVL